MGKAIIMVLAMSIVSGAWLGCGVDDELERPRRGQAGATPLAAMSVEERKAATSELDARAVDMFERADGSEGDPTADFKACREELVEERMFVNSQKLNQFVMLAKCMGSKGWKTKKAAP